ncbi:MAG: NFACT family protein [Oscillochloridaceae bacterium]|nr:NFACT family protein [Chloroflexaceae bacterium]MDW8391130.1 NFACT family protein [Oscillochloridaceae bacterium]
MYFDALTLAAVADELRETVLGGRVQRVILTGPLSLGLEVYAHRQRVQVLASAHSQLARVHLVRERLTRGVEQETPLLLLLRKYVLGGRIVGVEQPLLERVLVLSIVKPLSFRNRNAPASDPDFDEAEFEADEDDANPSTALDVLRCDLVIEPQDRRSNIILVDDDNRILDSVKRVTPRMSSRVVLPRHVYELPPPPDKRDPARATAAGIATLATGRERDLARALVAAYRGVSPQVAREAIFRALGRVTASVDEPLPHYILAARLRELFAAPPEPTLALDEEGRPAAYAPYALTHLPRTVAVASMSEALERFYLAHERLTGHQQRREALSGQLRAARARLERQRAQIAAELEKAREVETLRWEGEMIFAFMHTLRPGQEALEVEGRRIALDPRQNLVEQAQARFRAYDKARSALSGLPERLEAVENRIRGLDELEALLQLSDGYDQIEQLAREAEELGYLHEATGIASARRVARPARLRPLQLLSADGLEIAVGRSALENEHVTFRLAQGNDLWLHARGLPGSHVIVRCGGRDVPETTLVEAAGLAAYFSPARAEPAVEVDVCRRALVRKLPGGPPGLVTYRAERTLRVAPRAPRARGAAQGSISRDGTG